MAPTSGTQTTLCVRFLGGNQVGVSMDGASTVADLRARVAGTLGQSTACLALIAGSLVLTDRIQIEELTSKGVTEITVLVSQLLRKEDLQLKVEHIVKLL